MLDRAGILAFLDQSGIPYEVFDHPPVETCEEAERVIPHLPGTPTKNLFVRDKRGRRHFLVAVGYEKQVDLARFGEAVGLEKPALASPRRLMDHLGVTPGAVTLLGVANDAQGAVQVVIDRRVWETPSLRSHPMVNSSTAVLSREAMERFFAATGHAPLVMDVPGRS